MARARTKHDTVIPAGNGAPKTPSQPVTVDVSDIARRAYDLYQSRGCQPGHDVDDWMQAERELRDPPGLAALDAAGNSQVPRLARSLRR